MDSLLTSEWQRLEEVISLLEPFASQTDILQTDTQSLSSILPSLLDLECHLQQSTAPSLLTRSILADLRRRFDFIMIPSSAAFNPLPAAACLLDPLYCEVLLADEMSLLLHAAKMLIVNMAEESSGRELTLKSPDDIGSPALKRFKYLSNKMVRQSTSTHKSQFSNCVDQLNRYIADATDRNGVQDALQFWQSRSDLYDKIAATSEDLITAPASQAYVERIFSLCRMLTSGRRNRMKRSLEMLVFLKLNQAIV